MKTKASLKRKLWTLFSDYIRRKEKYVCFTCGKRGDKYNIDAGHFIGRNGHANTFFDEMNVHAQCKSCNLFHEGQKPTYALRLIEKYGHEEFKALVKRGDITKQWRIDWLENMIEVYKEKLN